MLNVLRTNSENSDFIRLVKELDSYLKITDGAEHDFYNQFNGIVGLDYAIVLSKNNKAVGCGAIKPF